MPLKRPVTPNSGIALVFLRHFQSKFMEQKGLFMLLDARQVSKSYETADGVFQVLDRVDIQLEIGATLALTGESGSGKSTLLHLVGGLDVPDSGQIKVNGADISAMNDTERAMIRRNDVGVVFQQFNLIPSLRVSDNIAFQARLAGKHDTVWCQHLADALGLEEQLPKFPEQLSGGQQQRVAIARTLAARPKLVLADEPTGNLDEVSAAAVMEQLLSLVTETGAGLLMVTHSLALADRLDRRLHLSSGKVA